MVNLSSNSLEMLAKVPVRAPVISSEGVRAFLKKVYLKENNKQKSLKYLSTECNTQERRNASFAWLERESLYRVYRLLSKELT
ncbi:hypothetical protein, partial [Klebsiella pneumoniae]|uniref:hypothetical protein n=1 Tax=Klebsiella pneumoniae TaxID=573 RepID=UPI004055739C